MSKSCKIGWVKCNWPMFYKAIIRLKKYKPMIKNDLCIFIACCTFGELAHTHEGEQSRFTQ
jgi:hypothetical protein